MHLKPIIYETTIDNVKHITKHMNKIKYIFSN